MLHSRNLEISRVSHKYTKLCRIAKRYMHVLCTLLEFLLITNIIKINCTYFMYKIITGKECLDLEQQFMEHEVEIKFTINHLSKR